MTELARSYAESNRELVDSFKRYGESRGWSPHTVRAYGKDVALYVEGLRSSSAVTATRMDIHAFQASLLRHGLSESSIDRMTRSLRSFYKFLRLADLLKLDPMLQVGYRKLPKRLPRVLTVQEVERVIAAAKSPVEHAIMEVLYSTGVRVSELCGIRLENVMPPEPGAPFALGKILIQRGKGGKDRYVIYGKHAAEAIEKYQEWRPSQAGYLFESSAYKPGIFRRGKYWQVKFTARDGKQHNISLGRASEHETEEQARARWEKIRANIPNCNYSPIELRPQGPYSVEGIREIVCRVGFAAGVEGVHPHSFRRAMACHMLASGADIRAIQELLGHKSLSTTQIYTTLTNEQVDKVYRNAHPHAQSREFHDSEKK